MLTLPNHPLPHSITPPDGPDLTGRVARCGCGREEPSSPKLAFFQYRGLGSREATETCGVCHYDRRAHDRSLMGPGVLPSWRSVIERGLCSGFVTRGPIATDMFYCGHAGWE